tara:strand:+ start:481 stop:762 length:282 start_codon:yes stop_codon:yes gene_type:complete
MKDKSFKINEGTNLTLDLKTIGIVIGFTISLVSVYYSLLGQIEEAKELPKPEISRVEFDLKDTNVRNTIYNIEEQVKDNSDKLDKLLFHEINN